MTAAAIGVTSHFEASASARAVCRVLDESDRSARREHRTLPTTAERAQLHEVFWDRLVPAFEDAEQRLADEDLARTRREVQTVLNHWFLRSRFWARSFLKPHGYAGDFQMMESIYDLEGDDWADPVQPAVLNLLDGLGQSMHAVQAVWHRRGWFADLVETGIPSNGRPVRVLDIACGGSRYIRDVIDQRGGALVQPTFVDQDPAALCFVRSWLAARAGADANLICTPIKRLAEALPPKETTAGGQYDVTISTGLFDYLEREQARALLSYMVRVTRPGGTVAICNFAPEDGSRSVKEWVSDWQLIYRSERELEELFLPLRPQIARSPDGGLLYASVVVPEGWAR